MTNKKPILPIMVDLETLSLKPNAAVIEIALVPFSLWEDLVCFNSLINFSSIQYINHVDVDNDTVAWHEKQGILIQESLGSNSSYYEVSIEAFIYLRNLAEEYEIHLWAQGKDFDIPVLTNFMPKDTKLPWHYRNTHCLRDLASMYPEISWFIKNNHRALSDAINQVNYIRQIAAFCPRAHKFIWGE